MSAKLEISAFCLDWHVSKSGAFIDMLVEPLMPYADIRLKAWDGKNLPKSALNESLVIFCMLPPSAEFLKKFRGKIVWLPMWDQAQGYDQDWWNKLPENLHVVAFSDPINEKATKAGLPTINLRYFKNPNLFKPPNWNSTVVLYWNRTGLVGPEFLENFCRSVIAKKLLFLGDIDPRIDKEKFYELPSELGSTKVESLSLSSRDEYLGAAEKANIFIAPRASEGVGMSFLEAMARGSAVVAYDAPTMNEYIHDGHNGLLLRNQSLGWFDKLTRSKRPDSPSGDIYYLSNNQDWGKISRIDFKAMGSAARNDHIKGFRTWQKMIPEYAQFVLEGL